MILADTSVWIDHLRGGDNALAAALDARLVLLHPYVMGELAVGSFSDRARRLAFLAKLPQAPIARPVEILELIERERIWGTGLNYVDVCLLATCRLSDDIVLLTHDRRLAAVAQRLGVA